MRGGLATAIGAALYERLVYADDGGFADRAAFAGLCRADRLDDPGAGDPARRRAPSPVAPAPAPRSRRRGQLR